MARNARAQSRKTTKTSRAVGRAAAGTTVALAGALSAVLVAPTATAAATDPTLLTSSNSNLQPVTNQLLQAQQQVLATNSAYPFITAFDQTTLPQYTQILATSELQNELGTLNADNSYDSLFFAPTGWNAPATDAFFLNATDPSKQYLLYYTGDQQTYQVTIKPGPGSQDSDFRVQTNAFVVLRAYKLAQFTPNPDGSYTITVSPTPQSGNWVDSSGGDNTLYTTAVGDWGLPHNSISIAPQPKTGYVLPVLSDDQISTVLSNVVPEIPASNAALVNFGIQKTLNSLPANTVTPIAPSSPALGPVLAGQLSSISHYSLQPGQALIIKVPNIDSDYSSIQAVNAWAVNLPSTTAQGSLDDAQTFRDADGYTYYVVSAEDPGVANWIDTSGNPDGIIALRWQGATVTTETVTAQVVPVADVKANLPTDTPTVTPTQRAAELKERMFEYDYARDQSYNAGWVTNNLEIDQIKAAMGADQFNAVFGGQQNVPSVLDRMTDPALMPDVTALAHVILTHPGLSLSAIVQNLPLAAQDIAMPMVLAALRVDLDAVKTLQAMQSDISRGETSHVPADLGAGLQGLATVANQTLTDPATSVTAGFLNARDDLAVSVMNASKYSALTPNDVASAGSRLSELNQSVTDMLSGGAKAVVNAGTSAATSPVSQVSSKLTSPAPTVSALSTAPKAATAALTSTPDSATASNNASSTNTGSTNASAGADSTGTNPNGASSSSGTGNTGTSTSSSSTGTVVGKASSGKKTTSTSSSSTGTVVGKASSGKAGNGPLNKISRALRDKAAGAKHDASQ